MKFSMVVGGWCEKNDNYSAMNTLFDIDKATGVLHRRLDIKTCERNIAECQIRKNS